jgi:hypothetical protein
LQHDFRRCARPFINCRNVYWQRNGEGVLLKPIAQAALKNIELLRQFKAVEQMNDDDRSVIKKLIDAFITKGKLKQLAL